MTWRSVQWELSCSMRTDGQTDNTELIAAFYNFANAPTNWFLYSASGLATRVCTLGYLLTYSMVQSPSWQANWFAASQEIPHISRNPKVHYRTHKRPPPVSILGQTNPAHIPTFHLLEIRHNIIHPSTPRSPQWSLSLRVPHQDPIHTLSSPIRATCPAHLFLLDFITRTILGEGSFRLHKCANFGGLAFCRHVVPTFDIYSPILPYCHLTLHLLLVHLVFSLYEVTVSR